MGNDKRIFIVSNLHRDESNDANNDVTITLPDSIFSGKIEAINMKHLYIDYTTETIGTSNYEFHITYPETSVPTTITLDIDKSLSGIIKTDIDLSSLIASSINATFGTTVFQVYFDQIIVSNQDVYRDNSDLLCGYTIFTNNRANFVLDFSSKRSLGPLIGFGNGVYRGTYTHRGGNVPPIYAYESIRVSNKAYDTTFQEYDQATDIACKMDLYDSENTLIPNYKDPRDATISLPITRGYITNVQQFIEFIETEINRYAEFFIGDPIFSVEFNQQTYRFTITNDKNLKFGIGFRFDRGNGSNNYGSLHRHLGFNKHVYLGIKSITSIQEAKIFERAYISEYLFVCSDLIKYNYDTSLIVTESEGNASQYESIFTIPTSQIVNGSYSPVFEFEHRTRIHASLLAKKYNEDSLDGKQINFYLKTSSGRHIKLNTQWSIKFEIEYIN